MGVYRLCFLSQTGEVFRERILHAPRNYDAVELAAQLADSAQCAGFELWNRHRQIVRRTLGRKAPPGG